MKGSEESRSRQKHVTARTRTDRIRELNDEFRSTLFNGEVRITQGIRNLGQSAVAEILACVCQFRGFTSENDAYGEHDFGSLQWHQQTIFWKIDYYDLELNFGSDNPADPLVTRRVLTIMFAREY